MNSLNLLDKNPFSIIVRWRGQQEYLSCWQAMRQFTQERTEETTDEIWFTEHPPVFTQGQNGKIEHILNPGEIPVIQTDRGGQVTYHGPGQLMIYTLIDLKRKKWDIRTLVTLLEQSLIDFLIAQGVRTYAKKEAPGVYVVSDQVERKIASIGLRIRRGASYHGIAFNVAMNLEPFTRINPCGFSSLKMTQLAAFTSTQSLRETGGQLINYLMKNLGYTSANYTEDHLEQ